jgi:nucleoside-diphosphate-sugar epimerase
MRVFVTGATGFIGAALIEELRGAGHTVLGLSRSEAGLEKLRAAGAEPLHGTMQELPLLRDAAAACDAVVHLAYNHDDFSQFQKNADDDREAIEAMGAALAGSDRPLVMTSGVGTPALVPGQLATEEMPAADWHPRGASERATLALVNKGVRAMVMRLPQVHDTRKQGLITYTRLLAKQKGFAAYVGDGQNRWAAAALPATAQLYRLAVEKGEAGGVYNAVDEEGVSAKSIADVTAEGFGIPSRSVSGEEAQAYFGWMNMFAGLDIIASSALTQSKLGWKPWGPSLLEDLRGVDYAAI